MENKLTVENLFYLISQEESETIEFKKDNIEAEKIGKYICFS